MGLEAETRTALWTLIPLSPPPPHDNIAVHKTTILHLTTHRTHHRPFAAATTRTPHPTFTGPTSPRKQRMTETLAAALSNRMTPSIYAPTLTISAEQRPASGSHIRLPLFRHTPPVPRFPFLFLSNIRSPLSIVILLPCRAVGAPF